MTNVTAFEPTAAPATAVAGLTRYGRLAAQLRQRILSGEWQPGESLPSEASLAKAFGVALGTMRQAVSVLVEEGMLVREQGRGTMVRQGLEGASMLRFFRFWQAPGADGAIPQSQILSRRVRRASADQREAFGLPPASRVLVLQRLRSLDGRPCLLESIALPLPLFDPLTQGTPTTWGALLYPLYQQRCGVLVARAVDRLRIVSLEADQAARLGLPPGSPGLCVERQARDRAGACVELRTTLGDAYSFEYTAELR